MEASRRAVASCLLLCLLLVHPGTAPSSLAASEDCWVVDHVNYVICFHQPKCRSSCQEHGHVDGRCAGFPNLVPLCECLRPNCPP